MEYLGIVRIFGVREGQATEPGRTVPGQRRRGGGVTGGGLQGVIGLRERGSGGDTLLTRRQGKKDKGEEDRARIRGE